MHIHYTGVVDINPELSAILGGVRRQRQRSLDILVSSMNPVKCRCCGGDGVADGIVVINVTFESGCERFKELETGVFVGAGRFVVDERGLSSEYKVSKVVMGG